MLTTAHGLVVTFKCHCMTHIWRFVDCHFCIRSNKPQCHCRHSSSLRMHRLTKVTIATAIAALRRVTHFSSSYLYTHVHFSAAPLVCKPANLQPDLSSHGDPQRMEPSRHCQSPKLLETVRHNIFATSPDARSRPRHPFRKRDAQLPVRCSIQSK